MTSRAGINLPVRRRVLGGRNAILLKRVAIIIPDTTKEKACTPVIETGPLLRGRLCARRVPSSGNRGVSTHGSVGSHSAIRAKRLESLTEPEWCERQGSRVAGSTGRRTIWRRANEIAVSEMVGAQTETTAGRFGFNSATARNRKYRPSAKTMTKTRRPLACTVPQTPRRAGSTRTPSGGAAGVRADARRRSPVKQRALGLDICWNRRCRHCAILGVANRSRYFRVSALGGQADHRRGIPRGRSARHLLLP